MGNVTPAGVEFEPQPPSSGPAKVRRAHRADPLGVRKLPFLSRRNYYYEFRHLIPWGLLVGVIQGNVGAIVVAKTFDGGHFLVAAATATPIGSLLFSLAWGAFCVGRRKLRLLTLFGSACAVLTSTVCLVPQSHIGGVFFVIQMAAAQIFLSGAITVRSALWKHNYPVEARGMITSRLQTVRMFVVVLVVAVVSLLFDVDPGFYRCIYPAVAASGLLGLLILQRMHVRHERSDLRHLMAAGSSASGGARPVTLVRSLTPTYVLSQMVRLLREDHRYARYLAAQMLLGVGVQMVLPVLVIILDESFALYWINVVIMEVMPKLLIFATLHRWGRLFDRVRVTRFRVFTGTCAAISVLFGLLATIVIVAAPNTAIVWSIPLAALLFALRSIAQGVQQGGGSLAWNLGHLAFAKRHDAELYMGVHVSLTGVRGIIAPFVGVLCWQWIGWGVWAVALGFCIVSALAFHRLDAELADEDRGDAD